MANCRFKQFDVTVDPLDDDGVFIAGRPNVKAEAYASPAKPSGYVTMGIG